MFCFSMNFYSISEKSVIESRFISTPRFSELRLMTFYTRNDELLTPYFVRELILSEMLILSTLCTKSLVKCTGKVQKTVRRQSFYKFLFVKAYCYLIIILPILKRFCNVSAITNEISKHNSFYSQKAKLKAVEKIHTKEIVQTGFKGRKFLSNLRKVLSK